MSKPNPCLAVTLVNPQRPQEAGSYLWCIKEWHAGGMHESYCGLWWLDSPSLRLEPTPNMILWRTGDADTVRGVSGRMLG